MLEEVLLKNARLEVMMELILERQGRDNIRADTIAETTTEETVVNFGLPVKSKQELDDLEFRLKNEPTFKKQLVIFYYYKIY